MKEDIDEILEMYGEEGKTGAIFFRSPGTAKVLSVLGLTLRDLSRTGRAVLKGDMIDQYQKTGPGVRLEPGYYTRF